MKEVMRFFMRSYVACLGTSKFIRKYHLYLVIRNSTINAHDSSISTCYEIIKQTSLFINMGKHENVTAVYLLCLLEKCSTQNQKGNSSDGDSKSFRFLKYYGLERLHMYYLHTCVI